MGQRGAGRPKRACRALAWAAMGFALLVGPRSARGDVTAVGDRRAPAEASDRHGADVAPHPDEIDFLLPPGLEVLPGGMQRPTGVPEERGFWIGSPDKRFIFRALSLFHIDARAPIRLDDGEVEPFPLFRRARLALEGTTFHNLDYRFMWDAVVEGPVPLDAYLDWRPRPELSFRLGRFKSPFGFERRARAFALLFNERAFATSIAPNRDIGLFVHGQTVDGVLSYDVAGLAGAHDGESIQELRGTPDLAGRVYVQPFRLLGSRLLHDFGLGASFTYGKEVGSPDAPLLGRIQTSGRRRFHAFREGDAPTETVFADGLRRRWSIHGHWLLARRVNFLGELVRSEQAVRLGEATATAGLTSWQLAVHTALTEGCTNSFFGVRTSRPFDLSKGHWGGASVAVRYHQLVSDRDNFAFFVDPAASARAARAGTVSFQWHVNLQLEAQFDVEYVAFDGGAPGGSDAPAELNFMGRLKATF
jgi:phosphate-selective porin OprO and OprP